MRQVGEGASAHTKGGVGQRQSVVEHTVAGGGSLVLMPTGGGKSLCFERRCTPVAPFCGCIRAGLLADNHLMR